MSNGGMVQLLKRDGTWSDCYPVGYKTHEAAQSVANKYQTKARVVNRKGRVLYSTEPASAEPVSDLPEPMEVPC